MIQNKECNNCFEDVSNFNHIYLPDYELFYHQEHFGCKNCKKLLNKDGYVMKDNNFYCENCYENLFYPYCEKCKELIKDEYVYLNNNKFHESCLKCGKCKKTLENELIKMNDKYYCTLCYRFDNILCKKCNKEIKGEHFKTSKLKNFHLKCFSCIICTENIQTNDSFIERGENFFHENCYKDCSIKKCYFCKIYIEGECLKNDNNYFFHKECIKIITEKTNNN